MPVSPEVSDVMSPSFRQTSLFVVDAFLLLGGDANLSFQIRIVDQHESPGLFIGSRWSRSGGSDAVYDNLSRYRIRGEMPH